MAKKLYVGGVPYSTTDEALRTAFSKFGAVTSVSILMDKMTGRSRGFGFVEMQNDEEADAAIKALDGTDFEGRKLTVNEARPMVPRDEHQRRPMGGDRGGDRGDRRDQGSSRY
jgi:cold-inducible RNA-binding protein